MQKQYIIGGAALVLIAGLVGIWATAADGSSHSLEEGAEAAAAAQAAQPASSSAAAASSSAPAAAMQATAQLFAQSPDAAYAHELYPAPAADAKTALGAFSYSVTDLGNGEHRVTIKNGNEGYAPQSVTVTSGQTVYFVERSPRDDTTDEDRGTRDDYLVAVDAGGHVLQ